ncbi:hypothetical protein MVEN_02271100 [Mycena venus]|uniref:Rhodopsin domain-containing protein n=1 Tax=Mycena venus TaxID=2733690 RepID=A0A8H6X4X4_9AGAR|nr:hypothetical protein MVEN_02271100 [Mycena venus]
MISLSNPFAQLWVTSATCSFFALGSTIYRLYQRRGRFGADDLWVVFASVALIVQVVAIFLHIPPPNNLPRNGGVAVFYLTAMTFYAIIWGSRLSILFSIIRIDPSFERRRRLFWVAVAFLIVLVILVAQFFWVCEGPFDSWKNMPNPGCPLPLQVALFQLVTDIIADSILLFTPLALFRDLINRALRRRLTLIFSTCVGTTVVSLVHAVLMIRNGHRKVLIAGLVEDSLSLIVANIPVVVTTMIDIVDEEDQSRTSRNPPFSSMFWYRESVATRVPPEGVVAVELPVHLVSEQSGDDLQLQCTKTIKVTSTASSQNDLESEQAV